MADRANAPRPTRVPPNNLRAEESVLGAMLLSREAIAEVVETLDPDHFYKPAHGLIFRAMIGLFERSEPVDLITLTEELRRRGDLERVGGELVLTELTDNVTTAANVEYHAHIVLEKSLMRQLITTSADVMSRAYKESEDALGLLDQAEQKIFDISEQRMKKSFISGILGGPSRPGRKRFDPRLSQPPSGFRDRPACPSARPRPPLRPAPKG